MRGDSCRLGSTKSVRNSGSTQAGWLNRSHVCFGHSRLFRKCRPTIRKQAMSWSTRFLRIPSRTSSSKPIYVPKRTLRSRGTSRSFGIGGRGHDSCRRKGTCFSCQVVTRLSRSSKLAAIKKVPKNADLPHPIGSDFPAMGKPYRDLSLEEFAILTSIAQERHKALNWLCGFSSSGRWADTPTHT